MESRVRRTGAVRREAKDTIETVVQVQDEASIHTRQGAGELTPGSAGPLQQTDQQGDEGLLAAGWTRRMVLWR